MTISRQSKARSLRDTIKAFRVEQDVKCIPLDEETLKLLSRLAGSDAAAKAFEELRSSHAAMLGFSDVHGGNFLSWCIVARQLVDERRGYRAEILSAEKTLSRMKKLAKDVALLRKFADDQALDELRKFANEENMAELAKFLEVESIEELKTNLDLVDSRIDWRRREIEDAELRLGASRKKHIPEAAENTAISSLAVSIEIATGKPHERLVADLATVILGREILIDRVHSAVRLYKPRLFKAIRDLLPVDEAG
jgi:hypothetical protein